MAWTHTSKAAWYHAQVTRNDASVVRDGYYMANNICSTSSNACSITFSSMSAGVYWAVVQGGAPTTSSSTQWGPTDYHQFGFWTPYQARYAAQARNADTNEAPESEVAVEGPDEVNIVWFEPPEGNEIYLTHQDLIALTGTERPDTLVTWVSTELTGFNQLWVAARQNADEDWTLVYTQPTPGNEDWVRHNIDLSAYHGKEIEIRYWVGLENFVYGETIPVAYWYLEDLADTPNPPVSYNNWESDTGWEIDFYNSAIWSVDTSVRGLTMTLNTKEPIALTGTVNPQMGFWAWESLSNNDVIGVDVKPVGSDIWTPLYTDTGNVSSYWNVVVVSLNAFVDQIVDIRIRIQTPGELSEGEASLGYWITEPIIDLPEPEPEPEPEIPVETDPITPTEPITITATTITIAALGSTYRTYKWPAHVTYGLFDEINDQQLAADTSTKESIALFRVASNSAAEPEAQFFSGDLIQPPHNRTIQYEYDSLFRLTGARDCHDLLADPSTCTIGSADINYDYTYDVMSNRLGEQVINNRLNTYQVNSYIYDNANRMIASVQYDDSAPQAPGTWNWQGGLAYESMGGAPINPVERLTYAYDANSNLAGYSTFTGATTTLPQAYTYDSANPLATYQYDAADRLIALTQDAINYGFTYNGSGDRIAQSENGVETQYLLDINSSLTQILGEFSTEDDLYYLLGLDVLGQYTSTEGWNYFGYDALGSTRFLTDSVGSITSTMGYDPYGSQIELGGFGSTNLGFTGEYTDNSGLLYLRARYLNTSTARFLSLDPVLGVVGGKSVTWNGYPYAHGNPINLIDPNGEFPILAAMAIGAMIGFGINALEQIHDLHQQGITDPLDVIKCLDGSELLKNAILGAVAGGFLSVGGSVGLSAALSGVGHFAGVYISNEYLGTDVNTSFASIATNVIVGGVLGMANNVLATASIPWGSTPLPGHALQYVYRPLSELPVIRGILYAGTGFAVTTAQNILTDDNPLESYAENGAQGTGALNAVSVVSDPWLGALLTIIANSAITASITASSNATDT